MHKLTIQKTLIAEERIKNIPKINNCANPIINPQGPPKRDNIKKNHTDERCGNVDKPKGKNPVKSKKTKKTKNGGQHGNRKPEIPINNDDIILITQITGYAIRLTTQNIGKNGIATIPKTTHSNKPMIKCNPRRKIPIIILTAIRANIINTIAKIQIRGK